MGMKIFSADTSDELEEKVNAWFSVAPELCPEITNVRTYYQFTDRRGYAVMEYTEVVPSPTPVSTDSQADHHEENLTITIGDDLSVRKNVRILEDKLIRGALRKYYGNRTRCTEALGISIRALLYKKRIYGIDPDAEASAGK